jgi:integrase/recombinase XerD
VGGKEGAVREQVNGFLRFLKYEKDSSDNTIAAYRNDLTQFIGFLEQTSSQTLDSWDDVDRQLILAYGEYLATRTYAPSTVARKVASVKSFFSFLSDSEQLTDNPTAVLYAPRVEKQLPRILSVEEVQQLLAEPAKSSTPKGVRDHALLELLYASGMRVSEIIRLRTSDINLAENYVFCAGRNEKSRQLPLTPSVVEALLCYLDQGRDTLLQDREEPRLFVNQRGRPLTRQGLWLITKSYAEAADLGSDVTPHTLRHSCAAHRLANGADLQKVRELLGHANISTTQVYKDLVDTVDDVADAGTETDLA